MRLDGEICLHAFIAHLKNNSNKLSMKIDMKHFCDKNNKKTTKRDFFIDFVSLEFSSDKISFCGLDL